MNNDKTQVLFEFTADEVAAIANVLGKLPWFQVENVMAMIRNKKPKNGDGDGNVQI